METKQGINVFLDDIRLPYDNYKVYRSAELLIEDINNGELTEIKELSLDHDLGLDSKGKLLMNGSQFVNELVYLMLDGKVKVNYVRFHTSNVVGYEYMSSILKQAVKRGFISLQVEGYLTDYLKEYNK